MFYIKVVEKIKTNLMFKNRGVYEIMLKYFVQPDRPLLAIQ